MTCIRPGECAVCQESIRDPFGSAPVSGGERQRREFKGETHDDRGIKVPSPWVKQRRRKPNAVSIDNGFVSKAAEAAVEFVMPVDYKERVAKWRVGTGGKGYRKLAEILGIKNPGIAFRVARELASAHESAH